MKIQSSASIIVQARMGSTRLPGKVLKKVLNRPLLSFLIERLQRCQYAREIIIATTTLSQDDPIAELARKEGVLFFRGDSEDVLSRYYLAAKEAGAERIVRITGDCPLMDPRVVDQMIAKMAPPLDFLSNVIERTYPRGLDVEILSKQALEKVYLEAKDPAEREHVTVYVHRHPELFHIQNVRYKTDQSHLRLTVDTPEDFELIRLLFEELYPKNPDFTLSDILKTLSLHPDWVKINAHIEQKRI